MELHSGHRQRLKERFIKSAHSSIPTYELLEMLLFFANPRSDTKPVAKILLERYKTLSAVLVADIDELKLIKGVGDSATFVFKLVREIASRMGNEKINNKEVLSNWQDLVNYCKILASQLEIEEFHAIYLDSKNMVIKEHKITGTIDRVSVYPREVIRSGLLCNAYSVVIMHNHPSGNIRPSQADIELTREVKEGLAMVNIELIDHIIVSHDRHFSFKNHMLI
jgi:DNA repair protein RadC